MSSSFLGSDRNANLQASENGNLAEIYESQLDESEELHEYIFNVEKQVQRKTGLVNNCTIENAVYAEAFTEVHNALKENDMGAVEEPGKVEDAARELVEDYSLRKVSQIGAEISEKFEFKQQYSGDGVEMEDDAVLL